MEESSFEGEGLLDATTSLYSVGRPVAGFLPNMCGGGSRTGEGENLRTVGSSLVRYWLATPVSARVLRLYVLVDIFVSKHSFEKYVSGMGVLVSCWMNRVIKPSFSKTTDRMVFFLLVVSFASKKMWRK